MNETEILNGTLNQSVAQLGALPVPAPALDLWGFDPLTLGIAAFIVGVLLLLIAKSGIFGLITRLVRVIMALAGGVFLLVAAYFVLKGVNLI